MVIISAFSCGSLNVIHLANVCRLRAFRLEEDVPSINIIATTRSSASVKALTDAGTTALVLNPSAGDYQETITELASKSDIVNNVADCDDLPLAEAALKGLKLYAENTGKVGALIHTSGVAIFFDDTKDGSYQPNGHFFDVSMMHLRSLR